MSSSCKGGCACGTIDSPLVCGCSRQVGEEDYNQDGKPELVRFTVTAQSRYPVNSFKLLLQFSYVLQVSWDCQPWRRNLACRRSAYLISSDSQC